MTTSGRVITIAVLAIGACAVGIPWRQAEGQRFDPKRPASVVVGPPRGASPTERVDAQRSGRVHDPLPNGKLGISWRKNVGAPTDHPVVAGADETLALVTTGGTVLFFDRRGEEISRTSTGAHEFAGPPTFTSDGTVVFATSRGDVFGVRPSSVQPRFRLHVEDGGRELPAPLPSLDGGVALAVRRTLLTLDAEGNLRARASLPEPARDLLASGGDDVVIVTVSGDVYRWIPGRDPVRAGSFGAEVDGATLAPDGTLLAVAEASRLVAFDLRNGSKIDRNVAAQELYLGPPSIVRQASRWSSTILVTTPTRSFVSWLDASGKETFRVPVGVTHTTALPDGGAAPLLAPPHAPTLVDAAGTIAFVVPEPSSPTIGVVAPDHSVASLGEPICDGAPGSAASSARVPLGLTPLGKGAFVVTCKAGRLVRVDGATP